MARRKAKRPKLFQTGRSIKDKMEMVGNILIEKTLDAGMDAIKQQKPDNVTVRRKPKYLEATEKRMNKLGVIDLKPYFARSKYRQTSKDGGWYLRVPIARKRSSMSRRMYEQLRGINIKPDTERVVVSDYLYDRRRQSEAKMLNYEPISNTINKRKLGKRKHSYVAYRMVSNKSPANSWIVNRHKINKDDTSKTFVNNVDRLMKWKMQNGWG